MTCPRCNGTITYGYDLETPCYYCINCAHRIHKPFVPFVVERVDIPKSRLPSAKTAQRKDVRS